MVVAVAEGRVPRPGPLPEKETGFMEQLRRLGISHIEEISARSLGVKKQMEALFIALAPQVNSDFHPFVQLEAPRARFEGSSARALLSLGTAPLPILEMAGGESRVFLKNPVPEYVVSKRMRTQSVAVEIARVLADRSADPLRSSEPSAIAILLALKHPAALCADDPPKAAIEQLRSAADMTLSDLAPEARRALWIEREWLACTPRSTHVRDRLEVYAAVAARDPRAMLARARALLAGPAQGGDDWGRYLLVTAMLGAQAGGEHEEAQRLWKEYRSVFYPGGDIPPYLVYLANLR